MPCAPTVRPFNTGGQNMAAIQVPEVEYLRLLAVARAAREAVAAYEAGDVRRHVEAWRLVVVAVETLGRK